MGNFSKAHIRATNKYNKKAYETISFRIKKGNKAEIMLLAKETENSINSFIADAITEKITQINAALATKNLSHITESNRYAVACQVRTNLRIRKEIPYQRIIEIFKGIIMLEKYQSCMVSFFEEVKVPLFKKFMKEQNITREEVLSVYDQLPNWRGEFFGFKESMNNGEF